jgi:hypothetical protein
LQRRREAKAPALKTPGLRALTALNGIPCSGFTANPATRPQAVFLGATEPRATRLEKARREA